MFQPSSIIVAREIKPKLRLIKLSYRSANCFKQLEFFKLFKVFHMIEMFSNFDTFQQTLTLFTFVFLCLPLFTFVFLCLPLFTFVQMMHLCTNFVPVLLTPCNMGTLPYIRLNFPLLPVFSLSR